ncbi:hypothetical protein BEI_0019 [Halomonas beimenensis]|uniref:Uncharacterized protein n=1 Tax=Halomonas beimenensis TaxID=475662 RepID=A0A291P294_9GAMM|nr:hypothetical protein BEI_0019 [Halomonas beimenensis]
MGGARGLMGGAERVFTNVTSDGQARRNQPKKRSLRGGK